MNVAEKLAAEISRVTELRCHYESLRGRPGVNVEPVITMIGQSLRAAIEAAGMDDATVQVAAVRELEGFKE